MAEIRGSAKSSRQRYVKYMDEQRKEKELKEKRRKRKKYRTRSYWEKGKMDQLERDESTLKAGVSAADLLWEQRNQKVSSTEKSWHWSNKMSQCENWNGAETKKWTRSQVKRTRWKEKEVYLDGFTWFPSFLA